MVYCDLNGGLHGINQFAKASNGLLTTLVIYLALAVERGTALLRLRRVFGTTRFRHQTGSVVCAVVIFHRVVSSHLVMLRLTKVLVRMISNPE